MTISELFPIDGSNPDRNLCVTRKVVGLPKDFNALMSRAIKLRPPISPYDVDIQLQLGSDVTLISPEEILNLYSVVDQQPTMAALEQLADYLAEELVTSSLGQNMTVEIRPLDLRRWKEPRDDKEIDGEMIDCCSFRSPFSGRLNQERELTKKALYTFFDIDPLSQEYEDVWHNTDNSDIGRLVIAHVIEMSSIDRMEKLFGETKVLPIAVRLEGVSIEQDWA
jgi:hypothetical protein